MADYFDVSALRLGDLKFQVTAADGTQVDFGDLARGFSTSDHVNTAGAQAQFVITGPIAAVVQLGDEGSSARVEAALVYPDAPEISLLWDGLWETVTDEREEGSITRYVTGFDLAKTLADNEEDWVSQNRTLSQVLGDMATEFELPLGDVPTTTTKLGQIIGRGSSLWAIMQEALQRHAYLTGDVYRLLAHEGKLELRRQGAESSYWTFEVGGSLRDVRRERTTSKVVNRVKIYGRTSGEERASVVEEVQDLDSQRLYGLRQRVLYVGSNVSVDGMKRRAQHTLDGSRAPDERLTITGLVVPGLRGGGRVRVVDEEWGIDTIYFAESVASSWDPSSTEAGLTLRKEPIEPGVNLSDEVLAL